MTAGRFRTGESNRWAVRAFCFGSDPERCWTVRAEISGSGQGPTKPREGRPTNQKSETSGRSHQLVRFLGVLFPNGRITRLGDCRRLTRRHEKRHDKRNVSQPDDTHDHENLFKFAHENLAAEIRQSSQAVTSPMGKSVPDRRKILNRFRELVPVVESTFPPGLETFSPNIDKD